MILTSASTIYSRARAQMGNGNFVTSISGWQRCNGDSNGDLSKQKGDNRCIYIYISYKYMHICVYVNM